MTPADLLRLRLRNHRLVGNGFDKPHEVVAWYGSMQAQDYLGSLWAIGQRLKRATETSVEAAVTRRAIVRTWPMRGTLHFVAADDVRWITKLLAPRVMARNAARLKKEVDVDSRVLGRSAEILTRALEGGRRLERQELYRALEARRIGTGGSRGQHILVWLAMQGTLCQAGRQGRQPTFALLDEWIPRSRKLDGEEALAELALRYFRSHGPATKKDFMWWAGITARQAVAAIHGASARLAQARIDDIEYWWQQSRGRPADADVIVRLLPAFDEYTVGYQDRSALANARISKMSLLSPGVLVDGRVIGRWSRSLGSPLRIATSLNCKLARDEKQALQVVVRRYADFLGAGSAVLR